MACISASVVLCMTLFASYTLAVPIAPALSHEALDAGDLSDMVFHHRSYWLGVIDHNGASPYNNDTSFTVYRNVMDPKYGAKGDGFTDDYAAIQKALIDGDGCANSNCSGSTIYPKLVYIPAGTYLISQPLQISMYTQIVGDPTSPTIRPSPDFGANYVLDGFPNTNGTYWNGGNAPLNFYKSIRNLNVDTTNVDPSVNVKCLNWAVSQATSIRYMTFTMAKDGLHQGIDMQGSSIASAKDDSGGSGTMFGDLTFKNGNVGLTISNQQFHFKNLHFDGCTTAISTQHLFIGVFQDIKFNDCITGIQGHPAGHDGFNSISLIDSSATNVVTVISAPIQNQSDIRPVIIDNLSTNRVVNIITDESGAVVLSGMVFGHMRIPSYARGVIYNNQSIPVFTNGQGFRPIEKPRDMLNGGKWFTKGKPIYRHLASSQVVNVKDHGARGDGSTDDLAALQKVLISNAGTGNMVYFPYGVYRVSGTLYVPPDSILQGEVWSSIRADGATDWTDENNPQPVLQVGKPGDMGTFAMTDMVVEPGNVYPGAKLVEINMAGGPGDIGIWDCVFRTGGTAAAMNQATLCITPGAECKSAWALIHITSSASAYLENVWGWNADHDIDPTTGGVNANSIQTGRGALIESTSPTFFVGVAMEHCSLYSVHPYHAQNLFLGMIQDETPYWQRDNAAPSNWIPNTKYGDPDFENCALGDINCRQAFGLHFDGGGDIFSYGSGVWTFRPTQTNDIWIQNYPKNLLIFNPNNGGSGGQWTNIITVGNGGSVTDAANPGGWSGGLIAAYLPFAASEETAF